MAQEEIVPLELFYYTKHFVTFAEKELFTAT